MLTAKSAVLLSAPGRQALSRESDESIRGDHEGILGLMEAGHPIETIKQWAMQPVEATAAALVQALAASGPAALAENILEASEDPAQSSQGIASVLVALSVRGERDAALELARVATDQAPANSERLAADVQHLLDELTPGTVATNDRQELLATLQPATPDNELDG